MRYSKYVKKPLETRYSSSLAKIVLSGAWPVLASGWRQNFAGDRSALLHHAGNAFLVMLALPARLASRCTAEPAQRRIATVCARRACVAT
eukprot:s1324_g6.t6